MYRYHLNADDYWTSWADCAKLSGMSGHVLFDTRYPSVPAAWEKPKCVGKTMVSSTTHKNGNGLYIPPIKMIKHHVMTGGWFIFLFYHVLPCFTHITLID